MTRKIQKYIPILKWLPSYESRYFKPDMIAGIILVSIMVPECMAFAQMAGVPLEYGFITALAAIIGYAIFGTSRQIVVSTTSVISIMSASIVAPLALMNPDKYLQLTAGLALLSGIIFITAGVLKMGSIVKFFSESVITGFIFGLALTIIAGQLPKIFGIEVGGGDFFSSIWELITSLGNSHSWTFFVGGSSLILLFLLKRFLPKVPAPLVVLIYSILISSYYNLESRGVIVTGDIAGIIPRLSMPALNIFDYVELIPGALAIALVGYAETISIARKLALKKRYDVRPNQELIALGMSNVSSGAFQGFAVDASLSKSIVNDQNGAKTQMSNLFSAAFLVVVILFLTPLFYNLPETALAAIIIYAVSSFINIEELKRYYAVRKTEFWIALVTLFGVLIFDILPGLIIAIVLSMLAFIYRISQPYIAVLGKKPHNNIFGDTRRHPEYVTYPGLLIVRLDAPLFFANAEYLKNTIKKLIRESESTVRVVMLNLESTNSLDFSSIEILYELPEFLKEFKVEIWLTRVHGHVKDLMKRTKLSKKYNGENIFSNIEQGVNEYKKRFNKG